MPFNAPAASNKYFYLSENHGTLVAFTVVRIESEQGNWGAYDVAIADVTICDGIKKGLDYSEQKFINGPIVEALKPFVGGDPVLGRVRAITAKNGKDTYVLDEPTAEDVAAAEALFVHSAAHATPSSNDEIPF